MEVFIIIFIIIIVEKVRLALQIAQRRAISHT